MKSKKSFCENGPYVSLREASVRCHVTRKQVLSWAADGRLASYAFIRGVIVQADLDRVVEAGGGWLLYHAPTEIRGEWMRVEPQALQSALGAGATQLDGNFLWGLRHSGNLDVNKVRFDSKALDSFVTKDLASLIGPFHHSASYTDVVINGQKIQLNDRQGRILKVLHEAHRSGRSFVSREYVMKAIGAPTSRFEKAFQTCPATYRKLVRKDPKSGNVRLNLD